MAKSAPHPAVRLVRSRALLHLDRYVRQWYQTVMSALYVSDETGRRTGVLLSIEDYQRLLEDLEDLAAIAERRDEPTVSREDLIAELKRNGLLPA